MKAGRELDSLVAEKVMGLTKEDLDRWDDTRGRPEPKHYSTDIVAAWEVVELLKRRYVLALRMAFPTSDHPDGWEVLRFDGEVFHLLGIADTAPEAICKAALRAVEVKE